MGGALKLILFGLQRGRVFIDEVNRTEAQQLLRDYAKNGAETAFRRLVEAYVDLVYSTAFRLVDGDAHMAQDVTQKVFVDLARNAAGLSREVMLGGWLHRHTCFVAANATRAERRRQSRERIAAEMNALNDPPDARFEELAPHLDEAINQLEAGDRTAILLRFFERRDFRAVGEVLGSSEDAARMRVARALEKLHSILKRHGVAFSAAALAGSLAGQAVTAAPAGLAATVATAALAGSATGAAASTSILKLITMTKLKLSLLGSIAVIGVGTTMALQHQTQSRLGEANELLRQQAGQLATDNESLSNQLAKARATLSDDEKLELLHLRGEVGLLKSQLAEAALAQARTASSAAAKAAKTREEAGDEERQRSINIARMNGTRQLILAFMNYAEKNQGRMPATIDQVGAFLGNPGERELASMTNLFEICYQGPLIGMANASGTIVLKESAPVQGADGQWSKTYGFADGHSEIHVAADGNFQEYEAQHQNPPPAAGNPNP